MRIDRENSYIDNSIGLGVMEGIISEGPLRGNSPCETPAKRNDYIQYDVNERNKGDGKLNAIHDSSTDFHKLLISNQSCIMHDIAKILLDNPDAHFTGYVNIRTGSYYKVVMRSDSLHFQVREDENGGSEVVVADVAKKRLVCILTTSSMGSVFDTMDLDGMEENGVIDLESTGRRWEGGVLNGCECCGYGKEYNDENNLVFEGFVFGGKRVCYGKEYRGIRNNNNGENGLIYEGGYWNGDRNGFGKLYNLHGDLEYKGEWVDNHPMNKLHDQSDCLRNGDDLLLSASIEELVIKDEVINDYTITSLHFSSLFIRLKKLEIGNKCFQNVRVFVLDGLENLESVKIGDGCFRISTEDRGDGVCRITNCPSLTQLEIGHQSFNDFKKFELLNEIAA